MEHAPCGNCGTVLTFNNGVTSAVGQQPLRAHTKCPQCAWTNAKVPGSALVDAQPPDEREED